jgi:hypothetical protein
MPYVVEAVLEKRREWNSTKGGPMVSHYVNLKDTAGQVVQNVEWAKKSTSPAPVVGEQVDGNIDHGDYGPKFKAAFTGGGGGRGGAPKSPEERAAIAASVAFKAGLDAVEQAATFGIAKPESVEDHAALVKRYADFAFLFIDSKTQAAK